MFLKKVDKVSLYDQCQGLHIFEMYLNMMGFLEKSLNFTQTCLYEDQSLLCTHWVANCSPFLLVDREYSDQFGQMPWLN